jgi:hypothetical protein
MGWNDRGTVKVLVENVKVAILMKALSGQLKLLPLMEYPWPKLNRSLLTLFDGSYNKICANGSNERLG